MTASDPAKADAAGDPPGPASVGDPAEPQAADSGAAGSGAADLGAVDRGAVGSGAAESGAVEPGAVEPGAVDSEAAGPGAVEAGAADSGAVEAGGLLAELRRICLGLPEVTERLSHGAPTWFVRGRKTFVSLMADGHHDAHFPQMWCAAPPGAQAELLAADPARFFRPPYVGHRGWLGVRLDGKVDWTEIAELCEDAFNTVAPKTLRTSR